MVLGCVGDFLMVLQEEHWRPGGGLLDSRGLLSPQLSSLPPSFPVFFFFSILSFLEALPLDLKFI